MARPRGKLAEPRASHESQTDPARSMEAISESVYAEARELATTAREHGYVPEGIDMDALAGVYAVSIAWLGLSAEDLLEAYQQDQERQPVNGTTLACPACGQPFVSARNSRYCSAPCRLAFLAAKRSPEREPIACKLCGASFVPRHHMLFCSGACRVRWHSRSGRKVDQSQVNRPRKAQELPLLSLGV